MKIILSSVTKGEQGENLPETSLVYQSGGVTVAAVETAARPTVLALIATGRMVPDSGTVAIVDADDAGGFADDADELASDGGASADDAGAVGTREDDALNNVSPDTDAPFAIDDLNAESDADLGTGTGSGTEAGTGADAMARLRAATAIVDAPDVSEPVGDLKFSAVVQEELMFADRPSGRRATAEALAELGVSEFGGWETQNVPTAVRLRVLSELAASRPGVEAIVLTAPDRRGSDPFEWWAIAADLAHRGLAVLVIASPASVDLLAETSARFEADRVADVARRAEATRTTEDARRATLAAPEPAVRQVGRDGPP
ncbi:hypothetical protein C5B96_16875, partial [Subtercola sp. Z020]